MEYQKIRTIYRNFHNSLVKMQCKKIKRETGHGKKVSSSELF